MKFIQMKTPGLVWVSCSGSGLVYLIQESKDNVVLDHRWKLITATCVSMSTRHRLKFRSIKHSLGSPAQKPASCYLHPSSASGRRRILVVHRSHFGCRHLYLGRVV